MQKTNLVAVITGDIVQSSLLAQTEKQQMLAGLQKVLEEGKKLFPDWNGEIFQGDSFQAVTSHIKESLGFALFCITHFKAQGFGLRIAIGIGDMVFSSGSVRTSDGSAFLHSGRTLAELKKKSGSYIGLKTGNDDEDSEYEVHCASLDFLLDRCTNLQAEALSLAITGLTQVQIADSLDITQPTVQQRLKAAGWPVFKAILHRFASKY